MPKTRCVRRLFSFRNLYRKESHDYADKAQPINEKADAFTQERDQYSCNGRSHKAGAVEHKRIQGNRISEVLRFIYHFYYEGLAGGHIEGIDHADKDTQSNNLPDMYRSREGKKGKGQGLDHGKGLSGNQHTMAIPSVRIYAGNRREKEDRDLTGKTYDAQEQCRIGEAIDQPAHGDLLHPGSDERDALTAKEEPVILVVQSPEDEFSSDLFACSGCFHLARYFTLL